MSSYTAPWGLVFSLLLASQSGTPYNLTSGYDLTGNNMFNARPAYGTCGASGVITTRYGCLDTNPAGKGERIVPFGVGLGPAFAGPRPTPKGTIRSPLPAGMVSRQP